MAMSSNRRAKWARPSSGAPACHEPTIRSPSLVRTKITPSASTRPHRDGSAQADATGDG